MSIEKPYQPTKEEIKKAEDMMTDKEKAMSKGRFEEKEKEIIGKIKSGQIKLSDEEAINFEKEKREDMKKTRLYFLFIEIILYLKNISQLF